LSFFFLFFFILYFQWKPTTIGPSARNSHAMAPLGDGKVLLFGGTHNNNNLKDTWTFDQTTNVWTKVDTKSTAPPGRYYHAMAALGDGGGVLLFGGQDLTQHFGDTWAFNPTTRQWTKNTNSTVSPSARSGHAMASMGVDGNVLLFGGTDGGVPNGETWTYDGQTRQWMQVSTTKDGPSARYYLAMALFGYGRVLLYGGGDAKSNNFNDAWIFGFRGANQNQSSWTKLNLQSTSPRQGHAMASLTFASSSGTTDDTFAAQRVLLLGGYIYSTSGLGTIGSFANDAWIMLAGCPEGMFGPFCDKCAEDQYKEGITTDNSHCTPCPSGTTTAKKGSTAEDQCVLCKDHSNYGSCSVDLSDNSQTNWNCFPGAYGPMCQHQCPGGTTNPCNQHGTCIGGTKGSGVCLCNPEYFGDACETSCACVKAQGTCDPKTHSCVCKPRYYGEYCEGTCGCMHSGTCDEGVHGTGTCTCPDSGKFFGIKCELACPCSNGRCDKTGTCVKCDKNYYGASCEICGCQNGGTLTCGDGIHGNGTCTCKSGFWNGEKLDCAEKCDCNGHSKDSCNVHTGACTCTFLYQISDGHCFVPGMGILITALVIAVVGIIIKAICRHNTKKVKKQQLEYQLLDVRHEETKYALQETKEDRNKLQEAWIVQRGDVKLMEVIGKGASGEVWRGRWRNLDVVCKKMFPQNMEKFGRMFVASTTQSSSSSSSSSTSSSSSSSSSGDSDNNNSNDISSSTKMNSVSQTMLENLEVGVMMRLRHPRIVAFLGAGELIEPPLQGLKVPRVGIFVMMEFAAGGDLMHRYDKSASSLEKFPWKDRVQCAVDIADGMAFIHRKGFIHRDLKSLNVLCDEQGRCMIADLGLVATNIRPPAPKVEQEKSLSSSSEMKEVASISVEMTSNNTNNHTTMKGTIAWMAPEVMTNDYGFKADVFSFGMVMYELLTCRAPWSGTNKKFMLQIETAVNAGERPPIEEEDLIDAPVEFVELMKRCWQNDPKVRPTFEEALSELQRMS